MPSTADTAPVRGLARCFERWNARLDSFGVLGLAALLLVVASGVVLAIGYDVRAAEDSLQAVEIGSNAGKLLRALHAWTSHLTLICALLHVVDHLVRGSDRRLRPWAWARLLTIGPLLLGAALSGFMLKGDAEGRLARQILGGLLERLPLLGQTLSTSLLGSGDDLQLIYLHHVATLTILALVLAVEHGRRFWPTAASLLGVGALALLLGALAPPRLHDGVETVVKGPWYFVGLQEILHWLTRPGWLWPALLLSLAAAVALPRLGPRWRQRFLVASLALLLLYAGACLWAALLRGAGWELVTPWRQTDSVSSRGDQPGWRPLSLAASTQQAPLVQGRREACLMCHDQVRGLARAHAPEALGCRSCHLGDPSTFDADRAHAGMVRVPGNLDTAAPSCGQSSCHEDVVGRVRGSLMASAAGMVAVDRFVFGEQPTPDGETAAAELGDSPADRHLRRLCVSCHLGTVKQLPAPITQATRGGGCAACHLIYDPGPRYTAESARSFQHPRLSVQVGDERCFGCHSRSGRIALNYRGWSETGELQQACTSCPPIHLQPAQPEAPPAAWTLDDGRALRQVSADVHFRGGMSCIDCHSARELMGDGRRHQHQEEAVEVRCQTCHRTGPARTATLAELDLETQAIVRLREGANQDTGQERAYLLLAPPDPAGPGPRVLSNTWLAADGRVATRRKLDGTLLYAGPPAATSRSLPGHARLSCRSCHAAWAPQCVSCHTQWDPGGRALDQLSGREARGAFVEYSDAPLAELPVMGVRMRDGQRSIEPFAPGMIMTLNATGQGAAPGVALPVKASDLIGAGTSFKRLYAPVAPHTTAVRGRSCRSCHDDPLALGLGRGELQLVDTDGRWRWQLSSRYAPLPQDGLPADAWTGLFASRGEGSATRSDARPLDAGEQQAVLLVGACLRCHDPEASGREDQLRLYVDFEQSLARLGPSCLLPAPVEAR